MTQDSLSDSRGMALRTFGGWEVPKHPGNPQKGTPTITQQMTNPMLTGRSASSGRQARRREVYNLLLSWSPSIRGAGAGAARFDRRAASDIASMR